MKNILAAFLFIYLISCRTDNSSDKLKSMHNTLPENIPLTFMEQLTADDQLIHKGILSPDLTEYFYTISDKKFQQFDIYVIKYIDNKWSQPQKATFNSHYSDHGMSFSPNGQTMYFSSTRPTEKVGVSDTWHIWKSERVNAIWQKPEYVDIPNLRNKLVSHPTLTESGKLYFHSSNLDYSEMDIYESQKDGEKFGPAVKTSILMNNSDLSKCTPFVDPNGEYLIFAIIGKTLDLHITYNDGRGGWINTRKLNEQINTNGQGNPFITSNNKFLFYTTGNSEVSDWKVNWVNIENEIKAESNLKSGT